MINFITNLPQELRSGGFSAMNVAASAALGSMDSLHYVGPVDPPMIPWQKALSKFLRLAGGRGSFSFYSEKRLKTIAAQVHSRCLADARLDFFHGFTPWVLTRPLRPYVAWSDCTFHDYIEIFHRQEQFRHRDLERIERAEAVWLKGARRVLFTSEWAAERALRHYGLDPANAACVGIFGELEMPPYDAYAGSREFAFVSTDFDAKGGNVVLAALRELRKRHPDASLVVVGAQPSESRAEPGVTFAGFLRKEIPDEERRFLEILGRVRALVSATKSDISPVVLVEAGYVGCPVISARRFAIPEIVEDQHTGLLLDDPTPAAVASAMSWMLEQEEAYRQMRLAAWNKVRQQFSRPRFTERLLSCVQEAVSSDVMPVQ